MGADSPLVFRPSLAQRSLAGVLTLGCWFVGIRAVISLVQSLDKWFAAINLAQSRGEPVFMLWVVVSICILACVAAGLSLVLSLLAFLLIEGCQVLLDELGLAVEYHTLPTPLALRLGAGRLAWRHILTLEKRGWTFVLGGNPHLSDETTASPHQAPITVHLRLLMVDQLERLLLLVMERSPHLR